MHWWDDETGGDALSAGHSQAHHRWGVSQHSSLTQVVQSRLDVFRISFSLQICTEHKPCEIDPVKLKESENLETNRVRGGGLMMWERVFVVSEWTEAPNSAARFRRTCVTTWTTSSESSLPLVSAVPPSCATSSSPWESLLPPVSKVTHFWINYSAWSGGVIDYAAPICWVFATAALVYKF